MGYRSDVLIRIPADRWNEYKELALKKCPTAFEGAELYKYKEYGQVDEVNIYFRDVKWYSSFEDVRAIEDSLRELHERCGMSYAFGRVGEECGDIDEEYYRGTMQEKGNDVYCVQFRQYIEEPDWDLQEEVKL